MAVVPDRATDETTETVSDRPVVVIGAGPVGLAAAAHLREHGIPVVVLEAGREVGAAMSEWGHIRTFTPWEYIVDAAAERLLAPSGWTRPVGRRSPTGSEIVEHYLRPLAGALGDVLRTGARVVAVSRDGLDRSRTVGRDERPFLVRIERQDGLVEDLRARAVIDASGTWSKPNPLGSSGLPALGEEQARRAGLLVGALPDVLGSDRERFAGRMTLVVGMGHSAANTLVALAQLAREVPGTRIAWAIRGVSARRVFGGGASDQLTDRGRLGSDLEDLVAVGALEFITGFSTRELRVAPDGRTIDVVGDTPEGERVLGGIHQVVAATGFRPDLALTAELQLDLHPGLEAPRALGPLVDPAFHSCGTVPPHGWRELAHADEPDFFVVGMKSYGRAPTFLITTGNEQVRSIAVGMKSYGRAPTFLITTGNEQVRSIAAHLAGDDEAADEVQLVLPETGVCSSSNALSDDDLTAGPVAGSGCCGPSDGPVAREPQPVTLERLRLGFATGVPNGRLGDADAEADAQAVPSRPALVLQDVTPGTSSDDTGGCCR